MISVKESRKLVLMSEIYVRRPWRESGGRKFLYPRMQKDGVKGDRIGILGLIAMVRPIRLFCLLERRKSSTELGLSCQL